MWGEPPGCRRCYVPVPRPDAEPGGSHAVALRDVSCTGHIADGPAHFCHRSCVFLPLFSFPGFCNESGFQGELPACAALSFPLGFDPPEEQPAHKPRAKCSLSASSLLHPLPVPIPVASSSGLRDLEMMRPAETEAAWEGWKHRGGSRAQGLEKRALGEHATEILVQVFFFRWG